MPSFFDLMKYARTGIASPDMTGFDKLRSLAAFGGYPVSTITGIPPISFKADGTPLTAWSIAGNGQQTGTPTSDAPIMPEFCGERTGNLFDESTIEVGGISQSTGEETEDSNRRRSGFIPCTPSTTYTISRPRKTTLSYLWVLKYMSDKTYIGVATSVGESATFTTGTETYFLRWYTTQAYDYTNIMLNLGSTALLYEPFGYKIPITCAGQTVPVYLGQTQTVRRVKKVVFDGSEPWAAHATRHNLYMLNTVSDYLHATNPAPICSHYRGKIAASAAAVENNNLALYYNKEQPSTSVLYIKDGTIATAADLKSYLAAQYAAGTPVTVWYVLAEPQTAIVNEPLCKIGDYADELHSTDAGVTIPTVRGNNTLTVDTDLQPSSMSVTGRIKPS